MTSLDLIKKFEGCRLKAYRDQGGVLTIGWGHTGPDVREDTTWTQEEADANLEHSVAHYEAGVKRLVTYTPLTSNKLAALTSFAYNVGLHNLATSHLLKALNQGNIQTAADQFLVWNKAGPYVNPGLTKRREEERKVFLG